MKAFIRKLSRGLRGSTIPDENSVILELLAPTSNPSSSGWVVDIGAHVGSACIPWGELGFRCLAFEPNKAVRDLLEIRSRGLPIIVDARALGSGSEEPSTFYVSTISTGIGSLIPFDSSHAAESVVEPVNAQAALESHGVGEILYLKIDVEGYDHIVLTNIDFSVYTPTCVMVEFEWNKTKLLGISPNEQAEYLSSLGYYVVVSEWYPIVQYGQRHRFRAATPFTGAEISGTSWGNLLGFRYLNDCQRFVELMNRRYA